MLRVLITGNMGYVGPVVVRHLRAQYREARLVGYDSGFFAHCVTGAKTSPESDLDEQYFGDVREIPADLFENADAVVHLAAISNDPIGRRFETATDEINFRASTAIAEAAQKAGVRNLVFASSCSVYGAAGGNARRETDDANPLTAYALSKVNTERRLQQMDLGGMTVTCLRFATACGMSPRLRLDLVLNDFVACAVASREITVLSDGMPWRPLIDVSDMARAIDWAITRKAENGGPFLVVNAGANDCNYRVKELAERVAAAVPGTEVSINTQALPDQRSYKVDFSLFQTLAPAFLPQVTLERSIATLLEGLSIMNFTDSGFRDSEYIRLNAIETHLSTGRLGSDLRWAKTPMRRQHAVS